MAAPSRSLLQFSALDKGWGREAGLSPVAEQWVCMFEARAGATARAVFATAEQAKQFAERHAQVTTTGMPLKWNDTNDPMVLATSVGSYRVVRTDEG